MTRTVCMYCLISRSLRLPKIFLRTRVSMEWSVRLCCGSGPDYRPKSRGLTPGLEIAGRVLRCAADADFEVQMGSSGTAGAAGKADFLALENDVAFPHQHLGEVGITGNH